LEPDVPGRGLGRGDRPGRDRPCPAGPGKKKMLLALAYPLMAAQLMLFLTKWMILKGKSHKDIQNELFISLNTVKNHVSPIYRKMGVSSRWQFLEKVK
jgi:hypothetical protein